MLFNHKEYDHKEALKANLAISKLSTERLGMESLDQSETLTWWLQSDNLKELVDRVEWVVNGSYGFEYKCLIEWMINDLPTTEKRRINAIKSIAIQVFNIYALLEYPDLNTPKIVNLVKQSGNMDQLNTMLIELINTTIEDQQNDS